MKYIMRTIDPDNARDIEQFNLLMDDLTVHAADQALLRSRILEANANPDKYLLVAQDPETGTLCGSLIGVCVGDFCETCNPIMLIENVVTRHDYRRRGVSRAMFQEIERWAREKQAAYAILCSANHRHEAHKFYEAIGYSEVKGFKKYL